MPNYDDHISELLAVMDPISLDEMSGIKLMNRIDTKFVASKRQLVDMLQLVREKYYVQEINSDRITQKKPRHRRGFFSEIRLRRVKYGFAM